MLVLSRTRGQSVMIGDEIDVTVIDMRGDKVRLGINAPKNVSVHRREVYDAIRSQNMAATQMKVEDVPRQPQPAQGTVAAPRTPEASPLFSRWKDGVSGVESYILSERVAPAQESMESPAPAMSADGRYLWFYCAFAPGGHPRYGRTLGVVDFQDNVVRHFPETQFGEASPVVDAQGGACYWSAAQQVYRREGKGTGRAALVGQLDRDALLGGQVPLAVATRLTLSADRKALSIDVTVDGKGFVGSMDAGSGAVEMWQSFDRAVSHAQFNPAEPGLMLLRQEGRLYTIRKGQKATALTKEPVRGEAWWSADGKSVYFIAAAGGLARISAEGGKAEVLWPAANASFHMDRSGEHVVAAIASAEAGESRLVLCNLKTGKEARIYTFTGEAGAQRARPRFAMDGKYLIYTTSAQGRADVAVTPTAGLIAATE
jgi:carbon storage regulator CsrA